MSHKADITESASETAKTSPLQRTVWTDRAKAAGKNMMQRMRIRRDRVLEQAKPGVESTDWHDHGVANYGEWRKQTLWRGVFKFPSLALITLLPVTNRLHRPITNLEAAYIDHLVSARRVSAFGQSDSRDQWRRQLQSMDIDHSAFADEIVDKRIHCHLEKILPRKFSKADGTAEIQERQRSEASKIYKQLLNMSNVMEVHTDASYLAEGRTDSGSGGGIAIKTNPEIRESCQMGSTMRNSSEAEIATIYRALQIVRDILEKGSKSDGNLPYRRILFATDSLNALEAMTGYKVWKPTSKITRLAALCRIEAYQIIKANKNIEGIDFIWLPRLTGGNFIADSLAKLGRLSRFNFIDDDRGRV